MIRVLGAECEEGQSFRNEMDEPEWRNNGGSLIYPSFVFLSELTSPIHPIPHKAINLAHASRHGQLDPPSPRRKLHLRRSLTSSAPLPSPTSTTFPPRLSPEPARPTSQTPPRTALASLSQGVASPAREPRRVLSLRGSKGSVRTPAVVTEDTEGECRAHRALAGENGSGSGAEDSEEEERRWESALRSAAARK